jgi:hypothetical protein
MPEPSKREIDARAYQLWEKAGRPEGREDEFWHLAQQELRNEDKSSPMRTLTRCNAIGRTYSDPNTCQTIASTKITNIA